MRPHQDTENLLVGKRMAQRSMTEPLHQGTSVVKLFCRELKPRLGRAEIRPSPAIVADRCHIFHVLIKPEELFDALDDQEATCGKFGSASRTKPLLRRSHVLFRALTRCLINLYVR